MSLSILLSHSRLANSMLRNTGSMESVVKYVVCRLPTIATILSYWVTIKIVQQLTDLTDRSNGQAY